MKTTPPPAAPDATALEPLFYAMRTELITCDGIGKTEKQRIVESAITHHTELQARCARLEDDGKRLDMVNENNWHVWLNPRSDHWTVQEFEQVVGNIGKGRTLREAIDAARTTKEATP